MAEIGKNKLRKGFSEKPKNGSKRFDKRLTHRSKGNDYQAFELDEWINK